MNNDFSSKDEFYTKFLARHDLLFPNDKRNTILEKFVFCIIGVGGNGSTAAEGLVRLGARNLVLIDGDILEIHNLNRQIYELSDVGLPKVLSLAKYLMKINPFLKLKAIPQMLTLENYKELLKGVNLIIDAADEYPAKVLISRYCKDKEIPNVHSAGAGFIGHVTVFLPKGPTYEEYFELPSLNTDISKIYELDWAQHRQKIAKEIAKTFYPQEYLDKMKLSDTPWVTCITPCIVAGQIAALEAMKFALGFINNIITAPDLLRLNTWTHEYKIIQFKGNHH